MHRENFKVNILNQAKLSYQKSLGFETCCVFERDQKYVINRYLVFYLMKAITNLILLDINQLFLQKCWKKRIWHFVLKYLHFAFFKCQKKQRRKMHFKRSWYASAYSFGFSSSLSSCLVRPFPQIRAIHYFCLKFCKFIICTCY